MKVSAKMRLKIRRGLIDGSWRYIADLYDGGWIKKMLIDQERAIIESLTGKKREVKK